MLSQIDLDEEGLRYVGQILAAIPGDNGQSRQGASRSPGLPESLSERETEILNLLARDLSNKEIAARLFISPKTVKKHLDNIYGKLNINSRRQAVEKAVVLGILSSD